jgi:hypothetical protein
MCWVGCKGREKPQRRTNSQSLALPARDTATVVRVANRRVSNVRQFQILIDNIHTPGA